MKYYSLFTLLSFVASLSFAQDFKTYSKFDFISGEKVVAFEDFAQAAIGDFPVKWNSNGSGEIVKIEGKEGKWLQLNDSTISFPDFIKNLPENFTMEFNLAANPDPTYKYTLHQLNVVFTPENDPAKIFRLNNSSFGASNVVLMLYPNKSKGYSSLNTFDASRKPVIRNTTDTDKFSLSLKPTVKISIWRQKTRLRVYFDEQKLWDIPRAFEEGAAYKKVVFAVQSFGKGPYYLSEIRLAEGAPDTRNKLMTEGKFITTGILFDSNSDKIKPESYGILKQIAAVLQENPTLKVRIIGHTDSEGEEAENLDLSKRRAASVKANLTGEFGIESDRLQTDGKGETQPITPNTTPEGKANNRRVEFIKM
ncbi:OmpA family protein [Runella sp.]|uniref:OmpA family protein n=1 Tax=Runella sp. TaxID=1960881 RepID=UPI00261398AC|nr:OmpA family protein [Runella sp.]